MAGQGRYDDREYRKLRAAVRAKEEADDTPCSLCGGKIDWTAPTGDPMEWTYDHEQALANGGDLYGRGRGAHRRCNSRRGKGKPSRVIRRPKTTVDWYA